MRWISKTTGRKKCLQDEIYPSVEKALLYLLYIHSECTTKQVWNFPLVKAILEELLHPHTAEEPVQDKAVFLQQDVHKTQHWMQSQSATVLSGDSKIPSDSSSSPAGEQEKGGGSRPNISHNSATLDYYLLLPAWKESHSQICLSQPCWSWALSYICMDSLSFYEHNLGFSK